MILAALMAMAMQAPAAGAAAAGSAATGTLPTFKSLCVSGRANGDTAIKGAEALGWSTPPDAMMSNMPGALKDMKNVKVRMSPPATGVYLVITGSDADVLSTGQPAHNATCMVMGVNVGAADGTLKADTISWMGAEPSGEQGPLTVYGYTETSGSRTILKQAQDQEAKAAFTSGKLHLVLLASQGAVNMMIYVVPTQAN